MSHRGAGGGYSNNYKQTQSLAQNGAPNRKPFQAGRETKKDFDDKEHIRFPDISRERRPYRREEKIKNNSRIPIPTRNINNEGQANEFNSREPRELGGGESRPSNFNSPHYPNSNPAVGRDQRKGRVSGVKRVTFYRNGDRFFKGVEMVVTRKRYRSFDTIVEELSKAVPLPYGVRTVFSPGGSEVTSINQLENGRHYICSSGDQLITNVNYGETMKGKPRSLGSGSTGSVTSSLSSSSHDSKFSGVNRGSNPRVIIVVSEHDKNKKCKVFLNRKTVKNYEDVLEDISDMLKYPVRELRTFEGDKVGGIMLIIFLCVNKILR